ncbi:MAG: hypothetical protein V3U86_12110 [Acidobacteriota bacterium]
MPQNVGKIGELLIQRGKLTKTQLNAALRNQGFFREHLGTTLFKMGFIDEDTLGEALAELSGVSYASPGMFEELPSNLVGLLPTKLAEKHDIIPLKLEGRKLHLVMLDPRDLLVLDEIAFITGYSIQPWIAPEFRIYDALERYYKLVSKRRRTIALSGIRAARTQGGEALARKPGSATTPAQRSAAPRATSTASTAPQRVQPAAAAPAPTPPPPPPLKPEVGLDGRPLDALPDLSPATPTTEDSPAADDAATAEIVIETLEDAGRALQRAETRDDVAQAILGYAGRRVKRTALFILQKDRVIGWGGRGQGIDVNLLKELQVPRDAPSIFHTVRNGDNHYLGGVPDTPANRELYRVLGGNPPTFILLTPINIKGRPVAALYADDAGGPLNTQMHEILKLGRMAALALEILILRTKIMMT